MKRRKKLLIAILVVIIIGIITVVAGTAFMSSNSGLAQGEKNILICAIDESEERPGMGACDMAFMITLDNGSLKNYSSIYPSGKTHPTVEEPEEAQSQGAGEKLLLHDAFWENDTNKSINLAKEIIEYNMSTHIDAVVAINSEALDDILGSAGTIDVNGKKINASGIDIIREEQYNNGVSRGDAVMDIAHAIAKAAENPLVKSKMMQAAINQYNKGNIVMEPQGEFMGLLASEGLSSIFK